MKIAGILLILAGVAALIYGGFSYTSQEKAVDMGPIQITRTEHHTIPVSPLLGIVAIAGGAVLMYSEAKSRG
jgi:drug/metabolite transporter (DMT)-like permease